jgi:hypothetical protein
MNKILHAASVIALTAAASSASAWYAAPCQAPALSEEQKQAIADQQKAMVSQQQEMVAQYAKAAQEAMAGRQEMLRKMAEQQASYFAELPKNAPETTAVADPFAGNPFGPMTALPGAPSFDSCWVTARRLMPRSPNTFVIWAITPGRSAAMSRT